MNVFAAPTAAGEAIGRDPRAAAAAALAVLLPVASVALLYFTEPGRKVALEQMRASMRGQSPEAVAQATDAMAWIAPFAVSSAGVGTIIMLLVTAGVLWVLFSALLGANLGFRHHFSIAAHAGIISGLGGLVVIATMLARGTMHASLSLAALVPGLEPTSVLYMSLAVFDFFTLWYVAAIGFMVAGAGRLRPATTLGTLFSLYALLGAAGVAVRAALR